MEGKIVATNTTILEQSNITQAKNAITTYMNTCDELNKQLNTIITDLTAVGKGFNGNAADGYVDFYNQVKPAFTTQLLGEEAGLMPSLIKILDAVYNALNATMDVDLGNNNKAAGAQNTVNVAQQNTDVTL